MIDQIKEKMNSKWLIAFLKAKYKIIFGFALLSAIIVFAAASLQKKKYTAKAVVYPISANIQSPGQVEEGNMLLILQIMESNELYQNIVEELDLFNECKIDTSIEENKLGFIQKLKSNTGFQRTSYRALEIKYTDDDPVQSAKICNQLVHQIQKINNQIAKTQLYPYIKAKSEEYQNKLSEVDKLSALITIEKSEKVDSASQRLIQLLNEKNKRIGSIRNELGMLRLELGIHSLGNQIDGLQSSYTRTQAHYEKALASLNVYHEKLSETDTQLINTEALVAGLAKKQELLKQRLDKMLGKDQVFSALSNQLALEIQNRDQLIIRLETIQNTYEPGVESVSLKQKQIMLENELGQLSKIKFDYEQALGQLKVFEPGLAVVSSANPPGNSSNVSAFLLAIFAFISMSLLCLIILLIIDKPERL